MLSTDKAFQIARSWINAQSIPTDCKIALTNALLAIAQPVLVAVGFDRRNQQLFLIDQQTRKSVMIDEGSSDGDTSIAGCGVNYARMLEVPVIIVTTLPGEQERAERTLEFMRRNPATYAYIPVVSFAQDVMDVMGAELVGGQHS